MPLNSIWLAIAVGLLTGILSGFGIGGGSLLLLYLTLGGGMTQYAAGGSNLLYFLCCAPTALWLHGKNGLIERRAAGWAAVGILPCIAAAWAASVIPTEWLRRIFGILLLYIGCREVFAPSDPDRHSDPPRRGAAQKKTSPSR